MVFVVGMRRKRLLSGLSAVGTAIILAAPRVLLRVTDLINPREGDNTGNSLLGRLEIWSGEFELFRQRPFLGHGWCYRWRRRRTSHNDYAPYVGAASSLITIVVLIGSLLPPRDASRRRIDLPRAYLDWLSARHRQRGHQHDWEGRVSVLLLAHDSDRVALGDPRPAGRRGGVGVRARAGSGRDLLTRPVLLVVSTLDGSGPGRVFATLAAELRAAGRWEPVLVTTHGVQASPLLDELQAAELPVEHLGMRGMWDGRGVMRFTELVRRRRPAVVHTRTIRADLLGRTARRRAAVLNNIVNLYPDDSVALHGQVPAHPHRL